MLVLHDYLPSLNGWKVRVLLHLLGVPFETRPVAIFAGEGQSPGFLAMNPTGAIPVLQLEDGRAIAESNAILAYLARATQYFPDERFQHASVLQWLFFEQYNVEPTIGSLRFWTLTRRLHSRAAMVPAKREAGERALRALDRVLATRPYLVGNGLTIADIANYAYSHRAADCGFDPLSYPAFAAWCARIHAAIGDLCPIHPYDAAAQLE